MKFRKADRPPDLAKVIKQKGRVRNVSGRTRVPASSRRNGKENTGKDEAPISSKALAFSKLQNLAKVRRRAHHEINRGRISWAL